MGRDHSGLKNFQHQAEPDMPEEKGVLKSDMSIEPEEAADAQSRQRLIGKELRRWYDNIVKEPVPDELLDLFWAVLPRIARVRLQLAERDVFDLVRCRRLRRRVL